MDTETERATAAITALAEAAEATGIRTQQGSDRNNPDDPDTDDDDQVGGRVYLKFPSPLKLALYISSFDKLFLCSLPP